MLPPLPMSGASPVIMSTFATGRLMIGTPPSGPVRSITLMRVTSRTPPSGTAPLDPTSMITLNGVPVSTCPPERGKRSSAMSGVARASVPSGLFSAPATKRPPVTSPVLMPFER